VCHALSSDVYSVSSSSVTYIVYATSAFNVVLHITELRRFYLVPITEERQGLDTRANTSGRRLSRRVGYVCAISPRVSTTPDIVGRQGGLNRQPSTDIEYLFIFVTLQLCYIHYPMSAVGYFDCPYPTLMSAVSVGSCVSGLKRSDEDWRRATNKWKIVCRCRIKPAQRETRTDGAQTAATFHLSCWSTRRTQLEEGVQYQFPRLFHSLSSCSLSVRCYFRFRSN